jgi:hypothetical protein
MLAGSKTKTLHLSVYTQIARLHPTILQQYLMQHWSGVNLDKTKFVGLLKQNLRFLTQLFVIVTMKGTTRVAIT